MNYSVQATYVFPSEEPGTRPHSPWSYTTHSQSTPQYNSAQNTHIHRNVFLKIVNVYSHFIPSNFCTIPSKFDRVNWRLWPKNLCEWFLSKSLTKFLKMHPWCSDCSKIIFMRFLWKCSLYCRLNICSIRNTIISYVKII